MLGVHICKNFFKKKNSFTVLKIFIFLMPHFILILFHYQIQALPSIFFISTILLSLVIIFMTRCRGNELLISVLGCMILPCLHPLSKYYIHGQQICPSILQKVQVSTSSGFFSLPDIVKVFMSKLGFLLS